MAPRKIEDQATAEAASALVADLLAVDAKCRENGHSIVELLASVSQSRYGTDVRPDPVPDAPEAPAAAPGADA